MKLYQAAREFVRVLLTPAADAQPRQPVREAAGVNGLDDDEAGWTRLSGAGGAGGGNARDLTPMSHDRMQRAAEWLWQSNLLANRLVEIPLAYLLAEGVRLTCADETHQQLLDRFWTDPINDWPLKLYPRARDLSLLGEQCYAAFVNEGTGFVRLGYVDPRQIAEVVLDPDNPEQPIGVVTRRDSRGRYKKFKTIALGPDEELFTARTRDIRAGFGDGAVFLFQVNRLATGTRGRSDLIGQIDWLDYYDEYLFGELDRARYMRAFVWDLNLKSGTKQDVEARAKSFKPPLPNSVYVHNDSEELTPKKADLDAADTSAAARLFRNHVLLGSTIPEHWAGGGGDVNRAAASEMGEPTFKVLTARQTTLKLMLEQIGRFVLASQPEAKPDWADPKWKVTAEFPELVSRDVTKFAAAMRETATAAMLLVDRGLLTEERALALVADIAKRFGQEIDAKKELAAAKLEHEARQEIERKRRADEAESDAFRTPGDGLDDEPGAGQPAGAGAAGAGAAAA